jgi:small subunit ribosomal protein S6
LAAAREYELVLMLDPGQDAPGRDAVAGEAKKQIEAKGTMKHENVWGLRKLAYEIAQRNEADYRWFRFEAPTELLDELNHSLRIADGVLRFRIFKVDAETPVLVPPATAAPGPSASRERPSGAPSAAADEGEAAAEAPAAAAEPDAEAAVEAPTAAAPAAVAEPPGEAEGAAEASEPEGETAEPAAAASEPAAEPTEPETAEAPAEGESGDSPT